MRAAETRYARAMRPKARPDTLRRRAIQPLWSALDKRVRPFVQGGVLLAVSGGPDSSALLEAAARWRRRSDGRLEVAAVDHGLRKDAAREVEAVRARALALGFEGHALRATPASADEATLRRARYRALWLCARDRGLHALCTAHHADDDAEGLLLDLLGQGGGREGAAMAPATRGPDGWLLRPFLDVTRAQLALALERLEAPAPFVDPEDERGGNARARLRQRVWPVLLDVEPNARERFAAKARRRAEDEAVLQQLAERALEPAEAGSFVIALEGLSAAVARRALQEAVRQLAPEADPRRAGRTLDRLLEAAGLVPPAPRRAGKSFDLPGVSARVETAALRIRRRDRTSRPAPEDPAS